MKDGWPRVIIMNLGKVSFLPAYCCCCEIARLNRAQHVGLEQSRGGSRLLEKGGGTFCGPLDLSIFSISNGDYDQNLLET